MISIELEDKIAKYVGTLIQMRQASPVRAWHISTGVGSLHEEATNLLWQDDYDKQPLYPESGLVLLALADVVEQILADNGITPIDPPVMHTIHVPGVK